MLLIDDECAVVGSTNWSSQAIEENNECSIALRSKELGAHYRAWVDSILARSTPLLKLSALPAIKGNSSPPR